MILPDYLVGLDLTLSIHNYILKHIEASPDPSPLLKEKLNLGDLGFKSGNGFYKWTDTEKKKSMDKLLGYLINCKKKENIIFTKEENV